MAICIREVLINFNLTHCKKSVTLNYFSADCRPIMIPRHTKYINMFSPCLFLYRFPICPYKLVYPLYIYISSQFDSLCKKFLPNVAVTKPSRKFVLTYLLCALRAARGCAHSKGLRSPA